MDIYDKIKKQWNEIFAKDSLHAPSGKESGNTSLDQGIQWLAEGSEVVLDFGCATGTLLFLCSFYGTRKHIGIDLSEEAIQKAKLKSKKMPQGSYEFLCGGIEQLEAVPDQSADAVILSNIIDNLYPDDAKQVLHEVHRILIPGGKVLVKLNPFLTEDEIAQYHIKVIKDNLLDDGMILWNNTTVEWTKLIQKNFTIEQYQDIYFEEYEQYNRMYLLKKSIITGDFYL